MKKFHEILKERRKEVRMTQQEFAERLNVSNKTVSKWETGKYYPDITLIASIAKVLNTTVDELMGSDDISRESVYENELEFDEEIVSKFKKNIIISISLFTSILLLYLNKIIFIFFNNKDNGVSQLNTDFDPYTIITTIISILVGISILWSITLFIISIVRYRGFYINQYYNSKYQKVFYQYSLLYFQIVNILITLIIFLSININSLFALFLLLISLLIISIIMFILKVLCGGKFKKDITSILIISLGIILFISGEVLIFFNIFPFILLSIIGYIILLIGFQRNIFTEKKI